MCLAGWAVLTAMRGLGAGVWFNVLRLAVVVPLAVGAYVLTAKLLRIEMLSLVTGGAEA